VNQRVFQTAAGWHWSLLEADGWHTCQEALSSRGEALRQMRAHRDGNVIVEVAVTAGE
jgi:hypothetical protein